MTDEQTNELRELLKELPFMANINFCEWLGVDNSAVSKFKKGHRNNFKGIEEFYERCLRVQNCK